jgi:hypothetical protein
MAAKKKRAEDNSNGQPIRVTGAPADTSMAAAASNNPAAVLADRYVALTAVGMRFAGGALWLIASTFPVDGSAGPSVVARTGS